MLLKEIVRFTDLQIFMFKKEVKEMVLKFTVKSANLNTLKTKEGKEKLLSLKNLEESVFIVNTQNV